MDIEELVRVREETILLMMEQMERVHSENADLTLQLKSIAPLAESAAQLQTDLSTLRESVRTACIPAIPFGHRHANTDARIPSPSAVPFSCRAAERDI